MKSKFAIQRRLDEITKESKRFLSVPFTSLSDKQISHVDKLASEEKYLLEELDLHKKAAGMMSMASPAEWGMENTNPGQFDNLALPGVRRWQAPEGQGSRLAQRKWHAPSPFDLDQEQLAALFEAGRHKTAFSTRVGEDGVRTKMLDGTGIRTKTPSAVAEGTPGSLIPPILLNQAFTLRLEPTRIMEFLVTGQLPTGQSISWLQHTGNTNPAAAVAELNPKPDIAPQIAAKETSFTVVAVWRAPVARCFLTSPTWLHSCLKRCTRPW